MNNETWKPIPGFSDYSASSCGKIRNKKHRILKSWVTKYGYEMVQTKYRNPVFVHRLVALAFHPNDDLKPEVNHIDGNKLNNYIQNLEWVTKVENLAHARKIGLYKNQPIAVSLASQGSKSRFAKLNETDIPIIFRMKKAGAKMAEIAKVFNMSVSGLEKVVAKKSWKHVVICSAALFYFSSCRNSTPPSIEVCLLSPAGGAACVERDGSHVFKVPSEITNYWCTNQADEAAFAAWAYDASPKATQSAMRKIAQNIHAGESP